MPKQAANYSSAVNVTRFNRLNCASEDSLSLVEHKTLTSSIQSHCIQTKVSMWRNQY